MGGKVKTLGSEKESFANFFEARNFRNKPKRMLLTFETNTNKLAVTDRDNPPEPGCVWHGSSKWAPPSTYIGIRMRNRLHIVWRIRMYVISHGKMKQDSLVEIEWVIIVIMIVVKASSWQNETIYSNYPIPQKKREEYGRKWPYVTCFSSVKVWELWVSARGLFASNYSRQLPGFSPKTWTGQLEMIWITTLREVKALRHWGNFNLISTRCFPQKLPLF